MGPLSGRSGAAVPDRPHPARPGDAPVGLEPGDEVVLRVGSVAHGGHFVARHQGRVVFVRHALPGELVRVVVTEGRPGDRYVRGDAIEILEPAAERVTPPCPWSGPGRCGGCDFQHVLLAAQRRLKGDVIREQFARLAGLDVDVLVEPVPGDRHGLSWRTRVEFAVDESGVVGLRKHRSHDVVPLERCPIAVDSVNASGVFRTDWRPDVGVDVVAPSASEGPVLVPLPSGDEEAPLVRERVAAGEWSAEFDVSARGFWQVHPGAAGTFVAAMLALLAPEPGQRVLDLYAGVGLFAAALAESVGPEGSVLAVESDHVAMQCAVGNLAPWPWAETRAGRVERTLGSLAHQRVSADLAVLDPPRSGAGRRVVAGLAALAPQRLVYVACDPAALARDTAYLRDAGYNLDSLRAFDAFPMTHHVECVALFTP